MGVKYTPNTEDSYTILNEPKQEDTSNTMFNKNIKYLRERDDLKQTEVGNIVNKERSAVSLWERGERNPSLKDLVTLSDYFHVTTDTMLKQDIENIEHNTDSNSTFNNTTIPVFKNIPNNIVVKDKNDVYEWVEIPNSWLSDYREYFGIVITDSSMEPDYKIDDVVIFQKVFSYESGKDYIVKIGNNNTTFKRILKQPSGILLQSINSNYETNYYTNNEIENVPINILGVAKEIRRKL